ncbi:MAG: recombinase family protein, partial [Natronosporangium sp.]
MGPKSNPRAGLYARQSHGKDRSITQQLDACRQDAAAEGYQVAAEYQDKVSASRHARRPRDDWPRLLADLAAGRLDVVVVWESSRGDRTLTSWSQFLDLCRQHRVLIRVVDHHRTYDMTQPRDWRTLAEDGTDNQYESEKTRQRIIRDSAASAAAGRPNGPVPYGYERAYHPRTRELVEQREHPEQAAIVREIFTRVRAGHPVRGLARDLQRRQVPPPGQWRPSYGSGWTPEHVRNMVRRKAYIGRRSHNGDPATTPAVWPPIVGEELFWGANRVLDDQKAARWRPARAEHVLSGVGACTACGSDDARYYGRHDQRLGLRYNCRICGKGLDGADYENLVLAYVLGRLARPDVYEQLAAAGESADAEAAATRAELARLTGELDQWREAAGRGETTPASLARVEAGYSKRIDAAQARLTRVSLPPPVRDLLDAEGDLLARWVAMPVPARRAVITALV